MNPTATSRAAGTPSHQAILRGSSRTWQKLKPLQLIGITLNPGTCSACSARSSALNQTILIHVKQQILL